jgi:SAM-dependent methyltransferase
VDAVDPTDVERSLATYYDAEAADRATRDLDPERVTARTAFLATTRPGEQVLEIGVGPDRDARALVDAGLHVVGVDLSLEHARLASRHAGARALVASVRDLPFADGSFDHVWTMSTLMHVPSTAIAGALTEVERVLRPGGRLLSGVWGGADVEDHVRNPRFDLPRLFSRRSDAAWRQLLEDHVGPVEEFRTWGRGDDPGDPFWYQFAVARRRPA